MTDYDLTDEEVIKLLDEIQQNLLDILKTRGNQKTTKPTQYILALGRAKKIIKELNLWQ